MIASIISIVSIYYLYDAIREDVQKSADAENALVFEEIEALKKELKSNNQQSNKPSSDEINKFIESIDIGTTRELMISYLGPPTYRAEYHSNKFVETYHIDKKLVRTVLTEDSSVEQYCVTVLETGETYTTKDGFVVGKDKFDDLGFYRLPLIAEWIFSNWRGHYRYEETGFAPSVTRPLGKDCCFGFHAIQVFTSNGDDESFYYDYIPDFNTYKEDQYDLRIRSALVDDRPTLSATKIENTPGGLVFSPEKFQLEFEKFRSTYTPDTYCSDNSDSSFRDSNPDLEKIYPQFVEYLKGE